MSAPGLPDTIQAASHDVSARKFTAKNSLFSMWRSIAVNIRLNNFVALSTLVWFLRSSGKNIVSTTIILTCGIIMPSA